MARTKNSFRVLATLLVLVLTSCNLNEATTSPETFYTQAAETMVVAQTLTAIAVSPTPSESPDQAASPTLEATNTPLITNTFTPGGATNTPIPLTTPQPSQATTCNNFYFVGDIGIQDNDEIQAGASFVKTWRVKNLGPCTWDEDYSLLFGWGGAGTNWSTVARVYFPEVVLPSELLDISVTLTAPTTAGDYGAFFVLRSNADTTFGSTLTVLIKVK